jgi:hypothetical protein
VAPLSGILQDRDVLAQACRLAGTEIEVHFAELLEYFRAASCGIAIMRSISTPTGVPGENSISRFLSCTE